MAKQHRVTIGDEAFHARSGQNLIEAAIANGIEFPFDCRAGRCGTCLTRVHSGVALGGQTEQPGMIHACQALVLSELTLEVEPRPPVVAVRGEILRVLEVAEDIVEVTIASERPIDMLPGQYCRFKFRGYPARPFSPTFPLSILYDDGLIRVNIKRVRGGKVTQQLGRSIGARHKVLIEGPFGAAYLRPGLTNRLVLIGSGTGFAPIWAVASAALRENRMRSIVLVAASRKMHAFYMGPSLVMAERLPNVSVVACIGDLGASQGCLRAGEPIDHLPRLTSEDIVYAAGAPSLVMAVGAEAREAGSLFYSDPFEPSHVSQSWSDRAKAWLQRSA